MNQIICHIENDKILVLTPKTDHDTILEQFEDDIILEMTITIENITVIISNNQSVSMDTLFSLDALLNYDTIEDVAKELRNTHNLDCFNYYPFDEEFFNTFFNGKPYEAVKATHTKQVTWSDPYVTFDGYGNLKTATTIPYEDDAEKIIQYWLDENI